jgi:hypothetical protein
MGIRALCVSFMSISINLRKRAGWSGGIPQGRAVPKKPDKPNKPKNFSVENIFTE